VNVTLDYKVGLPATRWAVRSDSTLRRQNAERLYNIAHAVYEAAVEGMVLLGISGFVTASVGDLDIQPTIVQVPRILEPRARSSRRGRNKTSRRA
jgi:hypothetical protein